MPIICPAILADTPDNYEKQIKNVAHFAHRLQIDLTDGQFAATPTVTPEAAWWPAGLQADFHLMYKNPLEILPQLLEHQPNLVIVHAEAEGDFGEFSSHCRSQGVKVGVALLASSPAEAILDVLDNIDHVLIFSGELGQFGGHADLALLEKVAVLKNKKPDLELGWDGGVNDQNASVLASGGIDVLNVGGFIQRAQDPGRAFSALQLIVDETGTT